jgi:L,D-transpeptidase ErfK/SrfK
MCVPRRDGRSGLLSLLIALWAAALASASDAPPHLVPAALEDGVLLNVPQRMIFVMHGGVPVASYPVGLGRPTWPTFVGPFTIVAKEIDPVWDVPPSIQEELRRVGKPVLTRVAPGPTNPLGKYWLGLSAPGFGIHGTNAPRSISRFDSHGCIRLLAADIEDLFLRVEIGTPGLSIYEPIVLGIIDNELWMEAHPDVYRRGGDSSDDVYERVARLATALTIDFAAVARVLRERDGQPHRIDSGPMPPRDDEPVARGMGRRWTGSPASTVRVTRNLDGRGGRL